MGNYTYDIWPAAVLPDEMGPVGTFDEIKSYTLELESKLQRKNYNGWGNIVLFPSCRAAIYSICELLELSRDSYVGISEWSSHCVIEAVGRLAMPMAGILHDMDCVIVSHQWGYPQSLGVSFRGPIIEDSCDSLITDKSELFKNNGRFEVLSLPKIFGTAFGGIAICRNPSDAEELRVIRETRSYDVTTAQYHLKRRYISQHNPLWYEYYCGMEAVNGFMALPALRQIEEKYQRIDEIIGLRNKKLMRLLGENVCSRYPVVVLLRDSKSLMYDLQVAGFNLPVRHFNSGTVAEPKYERCICLPMHQDINETDFEEMLKIIERRCWI